MDLITVYQGLQSILAAVNSLQSQLLPVVGDGGTRGGAALNPSSGSAGTDVTVSGYGFTGVTAVNFGTASADSFTIDSDTQITATVPGGSGGVDVTVVNVAGTSATSNEDWFSYED